MYTVALQQTGGLVVVSNKSNGMEFIPTDRQKWPVILGDRDLPSPSKSIGLRKISEGFHLEAGASEVWYCSTVVYRTSF